MTSVTWQMRIPLKQRDGVRAGAAAEGTTESELVRRAIAAYLAQPREVCSHCDGSGFEPLETE